MPRKRIDYHSGNSVHLLFRQLPKATRERLGREVARLAPAHGLTYVDDDGKRTRITLTLRPRLIQKKKADVLWRIIRTLDGAFQKIAGLYFQYPSLAKLFPFEPHERDWISLLQDPSYQPGRIVSRWDANTTFGNQDWKQGFSCFEVNGVGVGGLWYGPSCADVALKTVVPELRKIDPRFRPFAGTDMRRLLLSALLHQRKKIGRTQGAIAFVMEKASGSNYVEFECLARLFTQRGYPSLVIEPVELRLKKEDLYARGKKIDILYRDTTLSELCLLEEKGHDLTAFREAFRRGQAVSSLEGEFDHKSAFEVFSSPEFTPHFSRQEQILFKRYILWTRLLTERKTTDPRGKRIDLIPFVLGNQSSLVLKPNRLYGGKGVAFGRELTRRRWERKIESALKAPGDWVIQRLGRLRVKRFFRPEGKGIREKDLFVVSGFFATEKGMGMVGRMSERTVVNVARRGGLTPVLFIK